VRSILASVTVCFLLLSVASTGRRAEAADVRLTLQGDSLEVTVGGQPFTVYHFAKTQKKPYFWPVRSPGGQIMTRSLEKPKDHRHHKGLWFSVDEVNHIKFWAEDGTIENVSVEPIVTNGDPARFKVVNHWLGKDGKPILIESTTISIGADRVIAYDANLAAASDPVTFGDTKEGLFGFRLANPLREMQGGKAVNADGMHGTHACWGKPSTWVDYDGTLDGKLIGAAIFDNPHNFRPSRYHVRDYGLFSISPFGEGAYTEGEKRGSSFRAEARREPATAVCDLHSRRRHAGRRRGRDVSQIRRSVRRLISSRIPDREDPP
jgi:hypothetical protein